jgi:hypothetical protein
VFPAGVVAETTVDTPMSTSATRTTLLKRRLLRVPTPGAVIGGTSVPALCISIGRH